MLVKCLYCDVDNDALATGGFCESCGKKLPSSARHTPPPTLAAHTPPAPGEPPPLPKTSRAVSEGLFAASILSVFAGGAFLVLASPVYGWLSGKVPEHFGPYVLSWTLLPALAIAGLGVVARWQPMPAVALAFVFALLWVAATFVTYPALAVGWLLVDVVLFGALCWALWCGVRPEKRPGG
jgi:hypothetical protein